MGMGGGGGGGDALADVDAGAIEMLVNAMPALERAVMLSAVGVDRRGQFPYSVANMGGALDKRLAADQALVLASLARGFDYTILRVGKVSYRPRHPVHSTSHGTTPPPYRSPQRERPARVPPWPWAIRSTTG